MVKDRLYTILGWLVPFVLVALLFLKLETMALILTSVIIIGLFYLVLLYTDIKTGSVFLLIVTFLISPLSRYSYHYFNLDFPFGFLVDATIVLMFFMYIIKNKGKYEWHRLKNPIVILWTIWFAYTALQIANPGVISYLSFYQSFRSESFNILTVIMLTVLVFYRYTNFKFLTILWSVFASIAALKGIGQLLIGLDPAEYAFVFNPRNSTHMIFGQLRVFSFFSDAGTFGASQAQNAVISGILFIELKGNKERYFQLLAFLLTLTGMMISGTRGAIFVIFAGGLVYLFLKGKTSWFIVGIMFLGLTFSFLKYTSIMNGNSHVRRMRTALDPEDNSLQVRIANQIKLSAYMSNRPIGYGLGTIGVTAYQLTPYSPLAKIPTDSWYVRIWVENGIIGLSLYILILLWMMIRGALYIRKVKNHELKSRLIAVFAAIAGILVASYGNEILGQHPISIYSYCCMAFIFLAPQMDEELAL